MAQNGTQTHRPEIVDAEFEDRSPHALVPVSRAQAIVPRDFAETRDIASVLADTTFVSADLRGRASDIAARIMTGAELGLPPMASLRNVYIGPKGRPGLQVAGKLAACRRSGLLDVFKIVERNPQIATVEIGRRGEGVSRWSFTIEEARAAGLAARPDSTGEKVSGMYEKIPATLLLWRAIGGCLDVLFADVLAGVPDETTIEPPDDARPITPTFTAPQLPAGGTQAAVAAAAIAATNETRAEAAQAEKKTRAPRAAKADAPAPSPTETAAKPWPRSEDVAPPAQAIAPQSTSPAPLPTPQVSASDEIAVGNGAEPVHASERTVTPQPAPVTPAATVNDQRPIPPVMAGFREALRLVRRDHAAGMSPKEIGARLLTIKDEYVPWSKTEDAKAAGWHLDMRQEYAACWADVGATE